jgi:hypothetical protein
MLISLVAGMAAGLYFMYQSGYFSKSKGERLGSSSSSSGGAWTSGKVPAAEETIRKARLERFAANNTFKEE